jgi:hypothetical protein
MAGQVRVCVLAEGQTEEAFLNKLLVPALAASQVYLHPLLMATSAKSKGGDVTFARLKENAHKLLRQHQAAFLTTFIDLYALRNDFPDYAEAMRRTVLADRLAVLETAMKREILAEAGPDCRPERVIPYIQPHEFEDLLFSDVAALTGTEENWGKSLAALQHAREGFPTPEEINGGKDTHPSARLSGLSPRYRKTRHGPLAAKRIGLETMKQESPHFRDWCEALAALRPF